MRLIDADAMIRGREYWFVEEGPEEGFIGSLRDLVDGQPTAGPRWIPVTERLPEKKGRYLCTLRHPYGNHIVVVSEYGNVIADGADKSLVLPNGWAFGEEWPDGMDNLDDVIAWMPLPEPYKENPTC